MINRISDDIFSEESHEHFDENHPLESRRKRIRRERAPTFLLVNTSLSTILDEAMAWAGAIATSDPRTILTFAAASSRSSTHMPKWMRP